MYNPKPIDISEVELSEDLLELSEKLAENVHDVWASGRISQGWSYGEKRDDDKKQTPCLVPYDELPEVEKEYDRNTALSSIKAIVALGYKIVKE
ncbi:MAG: Ryanodine receptor Ryr [Ruminococcus sp.]|nr:Ryanodine receptor Ryr [Ruminococcus sp.]